LRDQSVWSWDLAVYGEWTLQTWQAKSAGPLGWLDAWLHVWGGRPPLIVWVGQFFVPFRQITGSFESALLLSNLAVAAGTLVLIYRLAREYSASWMETVIALVACGGSTLFVGLTHHYLTELLQCFTTASMMCVAFRAEQRPLIRTVLLMLITVSLSFAAKASSAPFVLPFLVYAILVLILTRGRARPALKKRDALLFIAAAAVAAATVAWYVINWEATVAHFVEATIGEAALQYGSAVVLSTTYPADIFTSD
jgi:4-amino-4-deoxy-L-arabinose transferase-like glycosyltransferase